MSDVALHLAEVVLHRLIKQMLTQPPWLQATPATSLRCPAASGTAPACRVACRSCKSPATASRRPSTGPCTPPCWSARRAAASRPRPGPSNSRPLTARATQEPRAAADEGPPHRAPPNRVHLQYLVLTTSAPISGQPKVLDICKVDWIPATALPQCSEERSELAHVESACKNIYIYIYLFYIYVAFCTGILGLGTCILSVHSKALREIF